MNFDWPAAVRPFALHRERDGVELGLSGAEIDAGAQARDGVVVVRVRVRELRGRVRSGDPQRRVGVRKAKVLRHDADHGAREAVEHDRPADQRGVRGEAPRPEPLAQHDDRRRVGSFVVRHERAAEDRAQAEQREQIRVRAHTLQALGLAVAREVVRLRHEHRDALERASCAASIRRPWRPPARPDRGR